MTDETPKSNYNEIKTQIEDLKTRLEKIGRLLNLQEESVNLLTENTKSLFKDTMAPNNNSIQEIMRKSLSRGKLPNILSK